MVIDKEADEETVKVCCQLLGLLVVGDYPLKQIQEVRRVLAEAGIFARLSESTRAKA